MTTHTSDLAHKVRDLLQHAADHPKEHGSIGTVAPIIEQGEPGDGPWPNRDGSWIVWVAPSDCLRGFKITVEMVEYGEAVNAIIDQDEAAVDNSASLPVEGSSS